MSDEIRYPAKWSPPEPGADFDRRVLDAWRAAFGVRPWWRRVVPVPWALAAVAGAFLLALALSPLLRPAPKGPILEFQPVSDPKLTVVHAGDRP